MASNGKKENLLNSWKDIAAYLDRDVRTCIRWEKQLGLPVHRLEKDARGKVFAYTDEIDSWLAERAGGPRQTGKGKGSNRSRRLAIAAAAVIVALTAAGILYITGLLRPKGSPADFRIRGSVLIVLDRKGEELWRFDTKRQDLESETLYRGHFQTKEQTPDGQAAWPFIAFHDLNGDGLVETLFSLQTHEDADEGVLFCLDADGVLLWRFEAGRELSFGGKLYRRDYRIFGFDVADIDGDGTDEAFVLSIHNPDWPCQFAVLDSRGRLESEYWNAGYLLEAVFGDIDGDGVRETILSGMNNEYRTGCVAIFRAGEIGGSSPQQDPQFLCPDLEPGTETAYLLFPTTEAVRAKHLEGEAVNYVWLHSRGGFTAKTWPSGIFFDLGAGLECTNVTLGNSFRNMYREYAKALGLPENIGRPYEEHLADGIRSYRQGKWVPVPRLF